jgi:hypothetical protein
VGSVGRNGDDTHDNLLLDGVPTHRLSCVIIHK